MPGSSVSGHYLVLLLAGALVALGLIASLFTARFGISHLLVFLVVGMVAGVDGPLGLPFDNYRLAFGVGNVALALILLDGGLRTRLSSVRAGGVAGLLLSSVGVLITTAVVAAVGMWVLHMEMLHAALLGAIVSSTDAAAVFSQLSRGGTRLPARVTAAVEIESGLNDPLAVLLTLGLITVLVPADASGAHMTLVELTARQLGFGVAFGLMGGLAMAGLLRHLPIGDDREGLTALLLAAVGIVIYAATSMCEGSGFMAVYLFGLCTANGAPRRVKPALLGVNGYTWLAESVMFLLLGLLVTPHEMARFAVPGIVIALALTLLARPLAVAVCLTPLGYGWRDQSMIAWLGLRGSVPIVLALYPVIAGVSDAYRYFDIAFVVVLCSLLLQATTIGPLARLLGMTPPEPSPVVAPDSAAGERPALNQH